MKQRGFTLIEVVMVILISAFLMAAVAPSAITWVRNTRIRTVAESISNGLQQARNEAVRRNQAISFYMVSDKDAVSMSDDCLLSSNSAGWVVAPASPSSKCASNRDTFVALKASGDVAGLSVSAKDSGAADATTVTFNGYGQITNALPISCIRLSNSSDSSARSLNIAINAGGQVRMCDPAVSNTNDPRVCQDGCK